MNTQIDHNNYPARLEQMSYTALRHIIKDASEALKAMPDNPKAGFYLDEINYCVNELNRRTA